MEVKNCKGCGRIFNYIGGMPLCPACQKVLDEKFQVTKTYIRENPRASLQAISEDCEVSVAQIKRWIREERLAFTDDSQIGIECEVCGAMIRTGRFCERCKAKMTNQLDNLYEKPKVVAVKKPEKGKERMRFLDQN